MAIKPGDAIGPYRIIQQLGAETDGGASVVFKAQDPRSGAEVVVRQLIPGSPGARERSFLDRCQREVDKQQALSGKARRVVLLKELIDDPRGAFLVTDFVSGASVEQLLSSRGDPFDLVRGLRIVHAVTNVLEQVHANGLIHGGLRPSSIILRLSGGVQVSGLGVSALIVEQEALSPHSARYMAPELFHGVAGDAKSDIYALGMVAYEMLAGRAAFDQVFAAVLAGPNGPAMRWMKWHTNARVKPTALHELNPRVPIRLSDLIARMMEKDRSKRIASAGQLLQAIHRHFGNKAIEQAQVSPDAFTPSGAQIIATGPGDTTELPTPSIMPRVIVALVLVLVMLIAGTWLTVSTLRSRALASDRSASALVLDQADQFYIDGEFDRALAAYQSQAQRWAEPDDTLGRHAQAGALLTRVQIDLALDDYSAAQRGLDELDQLGVAGPANRQAVKSLADELHQRLAFDQAVASILKHMQDSQYAQARTVIQQARRGELTEAEAKTLVDLQVQIDSRLNREKIDQALARARELADAQDLSGAINHLKSVQRNLESPRVDELLAALNLDQQFDQAMDRGESAKRSGDLAGALSAFGEALAIREDEALAQRVLDLKSQVAVLDGRSKFQAGDKMGARDAFITALGYDPGNAQARGWLARMDVQLKKQALLDAGRRAEASGDLAAAAGHYRAALKYGDDPRLEAVLVGVQVRLLLSRAERQIALGQLPFAEISIAQARRLDPDNPAVGDAANRYERHARYRALIRKGDDHVEHGRFGRAKQAYRQARDVMNTDEVQQRLDDTEYNHLIAQARGYIDSRQWASARAILDTAAKIRITDELTRLREEVRKNIDPSTEARDDRR